MWRLSELSKVCVNLVMADNFQPKILVVFTAFAYGKIHAKDVWGHDLSYQRKEVHMHTKGKPVPLLKAF